MQVNLEDVRLGEWRFRVGCERSPWQVGQLNAEGIAAAPSIGSVVQHCDTTTQLGQSGAVTKVAGRGFSDTAVIVHLTVYQPTRIVLRSEGLFQKRCHEQRNHVHACCASALVSCDLSLSLSLCPFTILSSLLLFLATVLHFPSRFLCLFLSLFHTILGPNAAYISSIVRSPAICPWFLVTPDGHACAVYTKHACTIRWMKRVNVSKQSTAKVSRGQSYPRHDRKTALATATRPTRPFISSVPVAAVKMIGDTS